MGTKKLSRNQAEPLPRPSGNETPNGLGIGFKYLLPCACGKKTPVMLSQAGETVRCVCGAALQIPSMREIKELEQCEQQRRVSSLDSKSNWGRREGQMLLGVLLTVIGLGLAAYFQISRPRLVDIASLSPIQTWMLWQDLRNGPDRHLSPPDQLYMERRAVNRIAIVVSLALASTGFLLMVVTSLMRKRRSGRVGDGRRPGYSGAASVRTQHRKPSTAQPYHSQ